MYNIRHILVNIYYLARSIQRKPRLLLRISQNYIKMLVNPKRPPLRFVDLALTYRCTMRCEHCSATVMLDKNKQDLSPEQWRMIGQKLINAGLLVVNLTGGEPTVRKDLIDIIKALQPEKLFIAIQTNGSTLTRERLIELREAGLDGVNISLDSVDPAAHDAFRRYPGAYEKAIDLAHLAKELGFNVGFSYVLMHSNLHSEDRQKMVELSRKLGAMLNYNLASPIGFWRGQYNEMLTSEDRQYLFRILDAAPHTKTDFETTYKNRGCPAIKEKLYINAYGEVMPCPFIQVSFGNILQDDVEIIRDRGLQYRYFDHYNPVCLAAEDMDFIKNTRCYLPGEVLKQMPIPHTEAFVDRRDALAKPDRYNA